MNKNWYWFLTVWMVIVLIGPLTLLINFPFEKLFSSQAVTINFFQRLIGLISFSLIFVQVVIGSMMPTLIEKLTSKLFRFHILEGIAIYMLIIAHPILGAINGVSLIFVFTREELLYNFGRIAFSLFTIGVFAGLFRSQPFLIRHWKKLHILNYVAFYLVAIHSYFVGSDTRGFPFIILWWIAVVSVSGILVYKWLNSLHQNLNQNGAR